MLKNVNPKLLPIILLMVLVLIIALPQKYVRRLLRIPQTFEEVESSDSKLLGLLLDKSKFTNDWRWDLIITYQQNHSNQDANVQEWASRQLVGYHDGRDVLIYHTIIKYLEPVDEIDVEPLSDSYVDQIPISILQDSTFLPPICHIRINNKEVRVTECVLARKHKLIHEKINIRVNSESDIGEISELVRNIAMFLDDKEVNIR